MHKKIWTLKRRKKEIWILREGLEDHEEEITEETLLEPTENIREEEDREKEILRVIEIRVSVKIDCCLVKMGPAAKTRILHRVEEEDAEMDQSADRLDLTVADLRTLPWIHLMISMITTKMVRIATEDLAHEGGVWVQT